MNNRPPRRGLSFTQLATCFAASEIVARTVTAPFDVATITAQIGLHNSFDKNPVKYMAQMYKNEGWKSFYKGNGTALAKLVPRTAIQFAAYHHLKWSGMNEEGKISEMEAAQCGALAGLIGTSVTYPLDTVKTRLITQSYDKKMCLYKGIGHSLKTIKNQEGYRGLFRGLSTTLASTVLQGAGMFFTYELLNNKLGKPCQLLTPTEAVLRGITVSGVAMGITFPMDTVRRNVQSNSPFLPGHGGFHLSFSNAGGCAMAIYRKYGIRGFYHGFHPALLRIAPFNTAMFMMYQAASNACTTYNRYVCPKGGTGQSKEIKDDPDDVTRFYMLTLQQRQAHMDLYRELLLKALQDIEYEASRQHMIDHEAEVMRRDRGGGGGGVGGGGVEGGGVGGGGVGQGGVGGGGGCKNRGKEKREKRESSSST